MSELARVTERLRQNRTARARELVQHRAAVACPEGRIGCTYIPGDRVFDPVTGQEGEVVGGTVENVVVPTAK